MMKRGEIRSILAATDLGPASDEVVRAATALAERTGARLHLVNALEIERLPGMESPTYPGRVQQANHLLADQARRVAPSTTVESLTVVDYAAHRAIEARVAEVSADLVVVGPHRGGPAGARFLGTTADRVIRTANVPTLVVRAPLAFPLRRIGVPTDLSPPAAGALDAALALAAEYGDAAGPGPEIRVFYVGWSVSRADGPAIWEKQLSGSLDAQVEAAVARVGGRPLHIRTEVVWGIAPGDSIADHARAEQMDLLVLGTHGQGGLRRLLVGSVASGVASQAHCPVLLVPPSFGEA
jgi:nucleotide-binding universal stress UspA family protein